MGAHNILKVKKKNSQPSKKTQFCGLKAHTMSLCHRIVTMVKLLDIKNPEPDMDPAVTMVSFTQ